MNAITNPLKRQYFGNQLQYPLLSECPKTQDRHFDRKYIMTNTLPKSQQKANVYYMGELFTLSNCKEINHKVS